MCSPQEPLGIQGVSGNILKVAGPIVIVLVDSVNFEEIEG